MMEKEKIDVIKITKDRQIRVNARVSPEFKRRFDKVCKEKAINGSLLIRNLLEQWLEENEK